MCKGRGHRSKVKVTIPKNVIFQGLYMVYLTCQCGLEVTRVNVKGHVVRGQWSRSEVKGQGHHVNLSCFKDFSMIVHLICDLEVLGHLSRSKVTLVKSNKDPK